MEGSFALQKMAITEVKALFSASEVVLKSLLVYAWKAWPYLAAYESQYLKTDCLLFMVCKRFTLFNYVWFYRLAVGFIYSAVSELNCYDIH